MDLPNLITLRLILCLKAPKHIAVLMNTLDFCNDHPRKEAILTIVSSLIIKTNKEDVRATYEVFKQTFIDHKYPGELTLQNLYWRQRSEVALLSNFAIHNTDTHIGVDIPSWFNFTEDKPRIMIVGIDPLRSGDNSRDMISIGTPYGLHEGKPNVYHSLVSQLAGKFSIYLTDTFKVFFREKGDENKNSYRCNRFTNPESKTWQEEIHQRIFAEEVKAIDPLAIITLGKKPVQWFTECKNESFETLKRMMERKDERLTYNGIPVLPFIHLSGRGRTQATKLYGVTSKDLAASYVCAIHDWLQ